MDSNSPNSKTMDYSSLQTPPACTVDFCLIPIGTGTASIAQEVADVQRLLKASGLVVSMHSAGTTVEGGWDAVMGVVGRCHTLVHQSGVLRIQTGMRIGTRTDKVQTAEDKVRRVREIIKGP